MERQHAVVALAQGRPVEPAERCRPTPAVDDDEQITEEWETNRKYLTFEEAWPRHSKIYRKNVALSPSRYVSRDVLHDQLLSSDGMVPAWPGAPDVYRMTARGSTVVMSIQSKQITFRVPTVHLLEDAKERFASWLKALKLDIHADEVEHLLRTRHLVASPLPCFIMQELRALALTPGA